MSTHTQQQSHCRSGLASAKRQRHSATRCLTISALCAALWLSAPPSAYATDAASREHAIEIALKKNGGDGKVLGVRRIKNDNGSIVFAVKVLSNGRVRVFRIKKVN